MQAANKGALIRAEQVAAIVGVSQRQAAKLMEQMPRINIGLNHSNPRWVVYEGDLQAWLHSRQIPAEIPGEPKRTRKKASNVTRLNTLLDATGHIPSRK